MEFDALYRDLAEQISDTARRGLRCAPGCGQCCERPSAQIEASVAEMHPLARHLWQTGGAEQLLDRARSAGAEGWCALYQKEPGDGSYSRGRCEHYDFRPLTCRLFGYAAVLDRHGGPVPLLSPVMKALNPEWTTQIGDAGALPMATVWRSRMAEVDPQAATDLLPLNEALVRALEQEGLAVRLSQGTPREPRP